VVNFGTLIEKLSSKATVMMQYIYHVWVITVATQRRSPCYLLKPNIHSLFTDKRRTSAMVRIHSHLEPSPKN
jgi:hypothetical protein